MENKVKRIDLIMLNGNPEGIIKCTEYNWSGVVYKAHYENISFEVEEIDSDKKGFYIIFFYSEDSDKKFYKIGKSKHFKSGKFKLYISKDDEFLEKTHIVESVIVIEKEDETINDIEFNYMKSLFVSKIDKFKNYENISEQENKIFDLKQSNVNELKEFVDNSIMIMKCLGYDAFRHSAKEILESEYYTLEYSKHSQETKIRAKAIVKDNKFIILADSIAAKKNSKSISNAAKKERYRARKYLTTISDHKKFTKDKDFESINFATQVLLGSSANWRDLWIDKNGNPIRDSYPNDLNDIGNFEKKILPTIKTDEDKNIEEPKQEDKKQEDIEKIIEPKNIGEKFSVMDHRKDLTNKKPSNLIIDKTILPVSTWAELRRELLDFLYDFDKEHFNTMLDDSYFYLKLSKKTIQLNKPQLFRDGIYVETCMNSNASLKFVYNLCKYYKIESYVYYTLQ